MGKKLLEYALAARVPGKLQTLVVARSVAEKLNCRNLEWCCVLFLEHDVERARIDRPNLLCVMRIPTMTTRRTDPSSPLSPW